MPANALVQTRIDAVVKERAAEVLEGLGLTVSEAVRILLTRTANEGAPPFLLTPDPAVHDAWFRAKVQQALDDSINSIHAHITNDRWPSHSYTRP
jgi:DNA-damage-inducible protein J